MEERKKLCDTCNWFDPERQLCFESGRYMIAKAFYCWAYDPIEEGGICYGSYALGESVCGMPCGAMDTTKKKK